MLKKIYIAERLRSLTGMACGLLLILALGSCAEKPPDTAGGLKNAETIDSLRKELRTNLNDADLRLRLARLYLREGDGAAAESHIRRAIKLGTLDPEVRFDLARSLLVQGNYFNAHEITSAIIEEGNNENSSRLWTLHGEALLGLNHYDKNAIREAFIKAFRVGETRREPKAIKRLQELAIKQPVVASARDHVRCGRTAPKLIDPPVKSQALPSVRTIKVGPTRALKRPSEAASEAQDGDIIEIDAGVYRGDVASWHQNNITLRGVGGLAQLKANGRHERGLGIWVFEGDNITVENVSFSGAKVPHRNGAGIRLHGKGSTIRNCTFQNNENGILGSDIEDNDVIVEFSTFINNGYGDGQSHNLYIGRARTFILRYSYSQGARVGHLVKSRAYSNAILYNRFVDGEEGNSSYVINLPEGGRAWIVGNELEQGTNSQNPVVVSFGEEQTDRTEHALYIVNNTFYNRILNGTFIRNGTSSDALVANNIFAGAPGLPLMGPGVIEANLQRPGPWFVDARNYDFRLTPAAPAIDAGINPATIEGLEYFPESEYRHPARGQQREAIGTIDLGAREFCGF